LNLNFSCFRLPPAVVLELSRSKIATWASVSFTVPVLAGCVLEAAVKWAVGWVLSHFQ
jgi:NhaP-type Na+/H+ or K+/H+ antiporter